MKSRLREKRVAVLADIIQKEVGWFNGWHADQDAERESCGKAAEKILQLVERWKKRK